MSEPTDNPELTSLQKTASLRKMMEAAIVAQAWEDAEFRALLESDPKAALAAAGMPVSEGMNVKIVSEQPNHLTIVLPVPPSTQSEFMQDNELEAVAGGRRTRPQDTLPEGQMRWGSVFNKSGVCKSAERLPQTKQYVAVAIMGAFGHSWAWQHDLL